MFFVCLSVINRIHDVYVKVNYATQRVSQPALTAEGLLGTFRRFDAIGETEYHPPSYNPPADDNGTVRL